MRYWSIPTCWCVRWADPISIVEAAVLRWALLDDGWQERIIKANHALAVANLPPLHRDPFDRMLLAQASANSLMLITEDRQPGAFPGPVQLMDEKFEKGVGGTCRSGTVRKKRRPLPTSDSKALGILHQSPGHTEAYFSMNPTPLTVCTRGSRSGRSIFLRR